MSSIYLSCEWLCEVLKNNYQKDSNRNIEFEVEPGRKYYKIVKVVGIGKSVHAFVDKETGDVYKAAGWNAPAKGIRYNLERDKEVLAQHADWAGGYLYKSRY